MTIPDALPALTIPIDASEVQGIADSHNELIAAVQAVVDAPGDPAVAASAAASATSAATAATSAATAATAATNAQFAATATTLSLYSPETDRYFKVVIIFDPAYTLPPEFAGAVKLLVVTE